MATMVRTLPDMERLLHSALDVAVPFERYQYLRGFIDGYQTRDRQKTAGLDLYSDKEVKHDKTKKTLI